MKAHTANDFLDSMTHHAASTALASYSLIVAILVGPLWGYHSWLVCRNLTTNENLKNTFEPEGNPHDLGCRRNCSSVLCAGSSRPSVAAEPPLSYTEHLESPEDQNFVP